ncbi:molybdenum cofactor guanylyltransferase [Candidatus Bipolaricaulota bacterium]|nr:molybdenum cofactor guanylyltransferase [Candidatus Bipolaricaulota bacterium]
MPKLSIAILCGGKSSRLGKDKTRIKVDGTPLYRVIWKKLEGKANEIFLQVNPEDDYDLLTRRDLLPERGPLGAIYSALTHASNEWLFVSACDLPNLDPRIINELSANLGEAEKTPDAVIPRWDNGYYEPLVALYRTSLKRDMRNALKGGTRKITNFLSEVDMVREISVDRLISEGSISSDCFFNVNNPEDVKELNSS